MHSLLSLLWSETGLTVSWNLTWAAPPWKPAQSQSRGTDLALDTSCALLGMASFVAVQNQSPDCFFRTHHIFKQPGSHIWAHVEISQLVNTFKKQHLLLNVFPIPLWIHQTPGSGPKQTLDSTRAKSARLGFWLGTSLQTLTLEGRFTA